MKDQQLMWNESRRETLLESPIFSVRSIHRHASDGREGDFICLDAPDWVTVVPLLSGDQGNDQGNDQGGKQRPQFIMVEQFRHGSGKVTFEFPAGTIDPGEDPRGAAERELLEETGYTAGSLIPLGNVSPNPAFMNNRVHVFLAYDLVWHKEQELDENEQIHTHLEPVEKVSRQMGTGAYDNGVMVIALQFFSRYKRMDRIQ
ncbi:MAG: NUDIX hydrolase [Spirochaetia bacterium]|nr:NUDIX hydrolase [Spirochaetia bacterium]